MDHFYQLPNAGRPECADARVLHALAALGERHRDRATRRAGDRQHVPQPGAAGQDITTLDVVSGGRAQLGIGAGWYELEHDSLGFEFGTFTDRFEKLEEALQIVTRCSAGERPTFSGEWYQRESAIGRAALPRPHPDL